MQAYKYSDLLNKAAQEQSSEAFLEGCLSEESYKTILAQSPAHLYTPNYFVRIGLALLTIIILLVSLGLGALLFSQLREAGLRVLVVLAALSGYAILEWLVREKAAYNAGVDNVLMLFILSCLAGAFIDSSVPVNIIYLILMLVSTWLCIRFTDAFMGLLAYVFFMLFVYMIAARTFPILAFMLLFLSGMLHVSFKKWHGAGDSVLYSFCSQVLMMATAVGAYASVNYWVVDQFMIGNYFANGMPVVLPALWRAVFWVLTIILPVAYLFNGIRKKKVWLIRTGVCLLIASIITFRQYYHVMPFEMAAIIGGLILIPISVFLIKWLKQPRSGFVFTDADKDRKTLVEAEATILAQAFGKKSVPVGTHQLFGGGSSGGAGASGNF